jgi:hypothetical protein
MNFVGRSFPISNPVISSGLDSVAGGIAQTTQANPTSTLDSAISTFSNIDPGNINISDFHSQILDAAEFSDPQSFLTTQGNSPDVLHAMNNSAFRPFVELSSFSSDLKEISKNLAGAQPGPLNAQIETLNKMQSTVLRLNTLQTNADALLRSAKLNGTPFGISHKENITKKRAESNPQTEIQGKEVSKGQEPTTDPVEEALDAAKQALGWFGDAAGTAEDTAENIVKGAIDTAKKALGWAGGAVADAKDAAEDFVDGVADAASDFGDAVSDGVDDVEDFFGL